MASQQLRERLFQIADAESKVAGALHGNRRKSSVRRPRKVGRPRGSALQDPHDFYTGLLEGGNDDYSSLLQGGNDDYSSLLQGGRRVGRPCKGGRVGRPRLSAKRLGALRYSMGVGIARGGKRASMRRRDSMGRFVKSGRKSSAKKSSKRSYRKLGLNMSGRASVMGSGRVGGNVRAQLKARLEAIAKHSKMSYTGGRRLSKRKSSKYNNGVLRTSMCGGRRSLYNNGVLRTARRGMGLTPYSVYIKKNFKRVKKALNDDPGSFVEYKDGSQVSYHDLRPGVERNRAVFAKLAFAWSVAKPRYGVSNKSYQSLKSAGKYSSKRKSGQLYKKKSTKAQLLAKDKMLEEKILRLGDLIADAEERGRTNTKAFKAHVKSHDALMKRYLREKKSQGKGLINENRKQRVVSFY
jgi:hypothetical protein